MAEEQLFGKKIIEILTTGMYAEDTTIFREYIQNSADSIRLAEETNIYGADDEPSIDIEIDSNESFIRISDNGCGVKASEVKTRLLKIASSGKNEDVDMGYRGIGRLCGLAYCDKLIFRTSYAGETIETSMVWDARKLEEYVDDPQIDLSPQEILNKVITYETKSCEAGTHYFHVELYGVAKDHPNLLNRNKVRDYVSETAPVDFSMPFSFRTKINKYAKDNGVPISIYNVTIEGQPVFKRYVTALYSKGNVNEPAEQFDSINDVAFKTFTASDGTLMAWMWYGLCNFEKALTAVNYMRGVRLRRHNIEMGGEDRLVKYFTESRGTYYFIGEVHIVHPSLRPNNQRTDMRELSKGGAERTVRNEFDEALKQFCSGELSKLYRSASTVNNGYKTEHELKVAQDDYKVKESRGFINPTEKQKLEAKIENLIEKNEKAKRDIARLSDSAKDNSPLSHVIKTIGEKAKEKNKENIKTLEKEKERKSDTKVPTVLQPPEKTLITDSLIHLNKKEKELIGRVYSVIQEIMPEDKAIILINKIQLELNK